MSTDTPRPFAVVTGASTGIGLELAKQFASGGYDVLVAAEDERIEGVPAQLLEVEPRAVVDAVRVDLSTAAGVEGLWERAARDGRAVDAVALHAGVGVGGEFTATDLEAELHMIDLNVVSFVHLAKLASRAMVQRGEGRLLFTSSLAARVPAPYQAVYGATKAFVQSLAQSLRQELGQHGVSVTAFLPGPTDTEFFERAGMEDTKMAHTSAKDDPATVAEQAFKALQKGRDHVVTGSVGTKLQGAAANLLPNSPMAKGQGKLAEPGSAD
ncbi:SDR family NAD(P)-dependent oxidoreductase [Kineococcus sp. SYSU DK005]|uniref:SDR family NAD(P)-dependent oxidoreductase n=1 Tax=Kineococcus sp. SYSU DK005 TaxID=3383126 RepID=UPI003D7E19DF